MQNLGSVVRYSKALLQEAEARGVVNDVLADMRLLTSALYDSLDLERALKSPVLPIAVKLSIINKLMPKANVLTSDLFSTLAKNGRLNVLKYIVKKTIELYDSKQGLKHVEITTAVTITKNIEDKILKQLSPILEAKTLEVKTKVDQSILGGFMLSFGDMEYDATMKSKLISLKRGLTK